MRLSVLAQWKGEFPCHKVRDPSTSRVSSSSSRPGACSASCRAVSSRTWSCTFPTSTPRQNVSSSHAPSISSRSLSTRTVPLRLAWFWVSNYASHIVGAFLATGILRLRGVNGHAGWRYLFLIEGCMTLAIGLSSFFLLPPGPTQTKAWFRPKGWFTERYVVAIEKIFASSHEPVLREEVIIVNRYGIG